jgi:ketosteroid isomerase-like protein
MQRFILRAIIALLTFVVVLGAERIWPFHQPAATPSSSQATSELLGVERELRDACVQRDIAAMDRILADDYTFMWHGNRVMNKSEKLAQFEDPSISLIAIRADSLSVSDIGDKTVVTGTVVIKSAREDFVFSSPPYRFSHAYEKRGGEWRLVATRVSFDPYQ